MDSFKKFKKLKNANSVCLIAHIDPDADALASMVVLKDFLIQKFNITNVDLFAEGTLPDNCLEILEDEQINLTVKQIYEVAIVLDCPNLERTGMYANLYTNAKIHVNIDHHATNCFNNCIKYFDVVSSTCEIIFKLLTYYKYKFSSAQLGKIYAGLLTDTDGFSVGAINNYTFKIASACVDKIKAEEIYKNFLRHNTFINQQLYATAINNAKLYKEGFVTTYITPKQMSVLKADESDCFGIANQLNTIYSCKFVCFVSYKNDGWYVSLRSKPGYDVSIIAKKFGGGGHVGAAAYLSNKSLEEILKDVCKEFKLQMKAVKANNQKLF